MQVRLHFGPKEQALVVGSSGVYQPHMVVPSGRLQVHVGGGQPDFYAGSVMGVVHIESARNLTRAYACA